MLGGWGMGFGIAGLLSQLVMEITNLFGTASGVMRPAMGYIYPLMARNQTWYVSAGFRLTRQLVFVYFLAMAIGAALMPMKPGPGYDPDQPPRFGTAGVRRYWTLDDPKGACAIGMCAGLASLVAFRVFATPIAYFLAAIGLIRL